MTSSRKPRRRRTAGLVRVLGLARPELRNLALGGLFLLVGSAATLAYPKAVEAIVDQALGAKNPAAVDGAALVMVGLFALQAVASGLRYLLFTSSGERVVHRLRSHLYIKLLGQEIGFFDRTRTGELLSRLSSDTQVLQNAVSVNISVFLRNVVSTLGGVVLLFLISPKLTAVMLLVVPPVAIGGVIYGRRIRKLARRAQDALALASEVAEESLASIRTVRAFAQEAREEARYASALESALAAALLRVRSVAIFSGATSLIGGASVAAVLWTGGRMVVQDELSAGELTAFLLYTVVVAFSLAALADLWSDFMRASGAAERVFELADRVPELPVAWPEGEPLGRVHGEVRFRGVHFRYPTRPDLQVLRGIDLDISPGERIALVGPSGAGKSTLAHLILRFYDPHQGQVLLDGHDLRHLDPMQLRERIAVVAQEPLLMSASIEENIRYGRPHPSPSDEEVRQVARAANAHDFIEAFPEGYRTEVGERGVQLSGGQKQRVAIARALIRDPRVLILDEATSALDAQSEHLVQQALDRLMEGRTTLIIAHRLSTVRDAGRVAVLNEGRVVQLGTHAQLMDDELGLYRRLVERQFGTGMAPVAARPHGLGTPAPTTA